jgi:hypothetical protein
MSSVQVLELYSALLYSLARSTALYTTELHSVLNCVVHCTVVYCTILS